MLKWIRITKNQWIGLFPLGFVLLMLQELPYIIMPAIQLNTNPLMEMTDKLWWLNIAEKAVGISCIIFMLFLVEQNAVWFSLKSKQEKLGFFVALLALVGYYIGWALYFSGHQSLTVMLGFLVALPPVYYAFIGIWRRNTPLFALGLIFLGVHIANVSVNLL